MYKIINAVTKKEIIFKDLEFLQIQEIDNKNKKSKYYGTTINHIFSIVSNDLEKIISTSSVKQSITLNSNGDYTKIL